MTDPVQEQLSACLDNELSGAELDLLLKRLERDPQLGRSMGRYAAIREALRDPRPAHASADFVTRVSAAVAAEQALPRRSDRTPSDQAARPGLKWLRPAVGMAIAASVAVVAVIVVQPNIEPRTEAPAQMAQAPAAAEPRSAVTVPTDTSASYIVPSKTTTAFIPATRLTNYVVAHSEYATPLGRRMVLNGVLAEDDTLAQEAAVSMMDSPPGSAIRDRSIQDSSIEQP